MLKKGEVYFAKLGDQLGSEQGGTRPVVIVQNNIGNEHSPTTIVVPLTSRQSAIYKKLPTHVVIETDHNNRLTKAISVAMAEQVRTIDNCRLENKIGRLSEQDIIDVDKALAIAIGLIGPKE